MREATGWYLCKLGFKPGREITNEAIDLQAWIQSNIVHKAGKEFVTFTHFLPPDRSKSLADS